MHSREKFKLFYSKLKLSLNIYILFLCKIMHSFKEFEIIPDVIDVLPREILKVFLLRNENFNL